MKNRSAIYLIASLLVSLSFFQSSCKKKDPMPEPTVTKDSVAIGASANVTIDVLANDIYIGSANLSVNITSDYGTAVITGDKKVLFTPKTNFYGTATASYTLRDDNGSSTGSIVIKVGTDAQIKTTNILRTYASNKSFLPLYALNGDTSRIYKTGYVGAENIDFSYFNFTKFYIESDVNNVYAIGAKTGNYPYIITSDGSLLTYANFDHSTILLTGFDYFTATDAKKHDGSGTMTVSGFTFYYGGKKLDYTTEVK